MGKPESAYKKKEVAKSPVSMIVVGQYPSRRGCYEQMI
jgi:hypothetical protein